MSRLRRVLLPDPLGPQITMGCWRILFDFVCRYLVRKAILINFEDYVFDMDSTMSNFIFELYVWLELDLANVVYCN